VTQSQRVSTSGHETALVEWGGDAERRGEKSRALGETSGCQASRQWNAMSQERNGVRQFCTRCNMCTTCHAGSVPGCWDRANTCANDLNKAGSAAGDDLNLVLSDETPPRQ
jgi:hypothetical protein